MDVLTAIFDQDRCRRFSGDIHPSFAGNVVKPWGRRTELSPITLDLAKLKPSDISNGGLMAKLNRAMRQHTDPVIRPSQRVSSP
ncbi:MAG: hypothetical protein AAF530_19295 [Pseudomonadota bacterium]